MFQVKTLTHIRIYMSITTQIKIRNKIAGWETLNVRTAREAINLARYESKGLKISALMAALTNPGADPVTLPPSTR